VRDRRPRRSHKNSKAAGLEKHRGSAWTNRLWVKKDRSAKNLQVGRNQQQPRILPHSLSAVFDFDPKNRNGRLT
jgi:hypothetical protein